MDKNTQATTAELTGDLNVDVSDMDFTDSADAESTENADAETTLESEVAEAAPETEEANQAETVDGEADKTTETAEKKTEENQTFELKYLGETKAVSREEIIPLAQKGMDYDRIRAKLDEAVAETAKSSKYTAFLDGLAKEQNLSSVDELIDHTNAQILVNKNPEKFTIETALERVKFDREKAEVAETKAKLSSDKSAQEKSAQDIKDFAEKFPAVKPEEIPSEVWKAVRDGDSLASAYGKYETAKKLAEKDAEIVALKAKFEAEKKAADNKERSTGSRQSTGNSTKGDPWLADLESRLK